MNRLPILRLLSSLTRRQIYLNPITTSNRFLQSDNKSFHFRPPNVKLKQPLVIPSRPVQTFQGPTKLFNLDDCNDVERDCLLDPEINTEEVMKDVVKRFDKVFFCYKDMSPGGFFRRLEQVLMTYKECAPNATDEDFERAFVLGCCSEVFMYQFTILDDIMDRAAVRYNCPAYHMFPGVEMTAINDALHMNCLKYNLIHKHFAGHPAHMNLIQLTTECIRSTAQGLSIDLLNRSKYQETGHRMDRCTFDRYSIMIRGKSGNFYANYPMRMALYAAGINHEDLHQELTKTVFHPLAMIWQMKNDWRALTQQDLATDIRVGQVCIHTLRALQLASNAQRNIIQNNYGIDDEECAQRVRKVYEDLDLYEDLKLYIKKEEAYYLFDVFPKKLKQLHEKYPEFPTSFLVWFYKNEFGDAIDSGLYGLF